MNSSSSYPFPKYNLFISFFKKKWKSSTLTAKAHRVPASPQDTQLKTRRGARPMDNMLSCPLIWGGDTMA